MENVLIIALYPIGKPGMSGAVFCDCWYLLARTFDEAIWVGNDTFGPAELFSLARLVVLCFVLLFDGEITFDWDGSGWLQGAEFDTVVPAECTLLLEVFDTIDEVSWACLSTYCHTNRN